MVEQSLKDKTVKGVVWSSVERFSVQGVQFLVMLVIARILDPKDYGLVGMLAIFLSISQTLVDSGFSQALIRKQDRTDMDCSTVFYFNIVISFILYIIFYLIAPWISNFFHELQLTELMRVLSVVVFINSFAVVQRARLSAKINFKTLAKASFFAAIVSGIAGIYMAYHEYGVWTLVYQQILTAVINTIVLWILSPWRPKLMFSTESFRSLFAFGSKLMASGLLDTLYKNLYQLIIGRYFSATSLGFYSRAHHFSELPSSNITGILQRVTYPVLCTIQGDDDRLRENYRKLLKLSAFIIFPLMSLLAGISYPLVEFFLGGKWLFAASLLIPLCFGMMWHPIHAINLNLLQVKGRTDLFLKLEIIKKVISVLLIAITIPFGVLAMCYMSILISVICLFVNTYYTGKLINVGFLVQMMDLLPTLVVSTIMFAVVFFLSEIIQENFINLFVGTIAGSSLYFSVAYIFKFEELSFALSILKK